MMANEGHRDGIVARAALEAELAEAMVAPIGALGREGPSTSGGAVAGDSGEFKAGALECLEGAPIQKWD
jgi:hypothetical protein